MYVIKFQKCGFPHAHMLIWLHPNDRPSTIEQIDSLVSAEIPHKETDPVGYNAVKNFMIHGPCGKYFSYSMYVKRKMWSLFSKKVNYEETNQNYKIIVNN